MNWNSSTQRISGNKGVVKMLRPKLKLVAVRPADFRPSRCAAAVMPFVYSGGSPRSVPVREQQAGDEHPDEARDAESGERGHDPVEASGREQRDDRDNSSTTIEAMKPGVPVMSPVESVNQLFAPWKPPAPIPMIRAEIWRFLSTRGTSKAMIRTEASTSVHDSSQPRNGWRIRL